MKKIEAIIKIHKLDDVLEGLSKLNVAGLTICEVKGMGRDIGVKEIYRGAQIDVKQISRIKLEIIESDEAKIEAIINTILDNASSNTTGDGRIFVYDVQKGYKIHTKELIK